MARLLQPFVHAVPPLKRFVYILRSRRDPNRYYTGVTSNVKARLMAHNAGQCTHTAEYQPWELDVMIAFREQSRALDFERYLKSGSGVAFAKRRLRSTGSQQREPRQPGSARQS